MMAEKIARGCEYRYKNQKRYARKRHVLGVLALIPNLDDLSDNPRY